MCHSGRCFALAAVTVLACAAPAAAQGRARDYSIGGRVLVAEPLEEYYDVLGAGAGFGLDLGYQVRPGVTLYAGFSRTRFPVKEAAEETDRVDSGIDLGVLVTLPEGGVPLLWLRSGVVVHEAETHLASGGGDGVDDGRSGKGLEGGIGLGLRLGRHVTLLPGVVYTSYPFVNRGGSGVSHLRGELGVRLRP